MENHNPSIFERYAMTKVDPAPLRPPGRPRTRTEAHFLALLEQYKAMAGWFLQAFGRSHTSDNELLKAYFADEYVKRGLRASRVNGRAISQKVKTLRNEFSTARRMFANPTN
jgi:hypothetical protein